METRVAVLAIIVRDTASVPALNELLHQYAPYIIGRMGVPYHARGVNIISVAVDAPPNLISALSGKLGRIQGVSLKTAYSITRSPPAPTGPRRAGAPCGA